MLWPFNQLRKSPASRGTIESIYGAIVAQARTPAFYADLAVPDTVNGRFDMIVLHLWLVLRRLRAIGEADTLGQPLIDRFCSDMDDNLRELGTSDLKVPKRVLEFSEAFYGRARAYDDAFANKGLMAEALNRNVYNGQAIGAARRLESYVRSAHAAIENADIASLRGGNVRFPAPRPVDGQDDAEGDAA